MDDIEKLLKQAKNLAIKGKLDKSLELFKKIYEQYPSHPDAPIEIARINFMIGNKKEAEKWLEKGLSIEPEHLEGLTIKAISLLSENKFEEAGKILKKLAKRAPKNERVLYHLGIYYRVNNNLKRAKKLFEEVLKINPKNLLAKTELGQVLVGLNELGQAERIFQDIIKDNPKYLKGYIGLGRLYLKVKQFEEAERVFKKGLSKIKNSVELIEELLNLKLLLGNYDEAMELAKKLIELRNSYNDYLKLGMVAILKKDFYLAEQSYKKSIKMHPERWEAYYNLAELYFSSGMYERSRNMYLQALKLQPHDFKPYNGYGLLLLHLNQNLDEAEKYLVKAHQLAPNRKEPLLNLALLYAKKGDKRRANIWAKKALKYSEPGDGVYEQAQKILSQI